MQQESRPSIAHTSTHINYTLHCNHLWDPSLNRRKMFSNATDLPHHLRSPQSKSPWAFCCTSSICKLSNAFQLVEAQNFQQRERLSKERGGHRSKCTSSESVVANVGNVGATQDRVKITRVNRERTTLARLGSFASIEKHRSSHSVAHREKMHSVGHVTKFSAPVPSTMWRTLRNDCRVWLPGEWVYVFWRISRDR